MNNLNDILEFKNPWENDSFYEFENDDEKKAFKEWFKNNAKHFHRDNSYDFSSDLLKELNPGGCYGNGQYLSLNNKIRYVEGIVAPNGTYVSDEYIPHGFNIINNAVTDFTYKKIVNESPKYLSELPSEYFGIEIPDSYIMKKNEEQILTPLLLHRPLLLHYWRDVLQQCKKVGNGAVV